MNLNFFKTIIVCLVVISAHNSCNRVETENLGHEQVESIFPYSDSSNNGGWQLISTLTDEFDEPVLNLSKWTNLYPGWEGRFPSWFVKENVFISNGELLITMKKESLPEMGDNFEYSTGVLRSLESFSYGYCEIRAQSMSSSGSSAFFLNNIQADWWTEIDVFEIGGNADGFENLINTNIHEFYNPTNVISPYIIDEKTHFFHSESFSRDWRSDSSYHVYGIEWDSDSIKWYLDGELLRQESNIRWHQDLFINIDSEVIVDWFGLPNENDLPSIFYIDYVRTWQKP